MDSLTISLRKHTKTLILSRRASRAGGKMKVLVYFLKGTLRKSSINYPGARRIPGRQKTSPGQPLRIRTQSRPGRQNPGERKTSPGHRKTSSGQPPRMRDQSRPGRRNPGERKTSPGRRKTNPGEHLRIRAQSRPGRWNPGEQKTSPGELPRIGIQSRPVQSSPGEQKTSPGGLDFTRPPPPCSRGIR